ncbi:hypothetical protein TWF506_003439 [Arthrobotrys conoides]|uniref:Uncharacterized protein n=1 Tax=Arthrobotrys conoides TaxID=74498 RepID=A0AAN8RJJ3_9PEZI
MNYSILSWLPRYLFPGTSSSSSSIEEFPIQITDKIIVPKYALDILATKPFIKPAEYHIIYQWVRIGLQTDDEQIISEALRAIEESANPGIADTDIEGFPTAQKVY